MAGKKDASTNPTTEQTISVKRTTVARAGWIAGGVLALGVTFAAGAVFGHTTSGFPRGDDFAAGHREGFGPGDHRFGDGDRDGDRPLNGVTVPAPPATP